MPLIADSEGIFAVQLAEQASNYATPAAGFVRIFAKAGALYIIDSAGVVTELGGSVPGNGVFATVALGDGTVTAPALLFTSDPNTGLYSLSADALALTAGGKKILAGYYNGGNPFVVVGDGTGAASAALNGAAATNRDYSWQSAGVERWTLREDNVAETGSNLGSNLRLLARDDSGALLSTPLSVRRSSGNIGIGTISPAAKLHVLGIADAVQQIVQGFSTQTNDLWQDKNNAGTILNSGPGAGGIRLHSNPGAGLASTVTLTNDVSGTPANGVTPTKWLKVYDGTTARFIPLYT